MATVGTLTINLRATTQALQRGLGRARSAVASVGSSFRRVARGPIGLMTGAVTALAGGSMGFLIAQQARLIDSTAKMGDRLGIATSELQALQLAARLTGNSTQNLELGLQRMTRRISEAAQGTGEAKAAIKELGLDAKKLATLTPDEQFRTLADAFESVGSSSDRVRLAFKLFDSEGVGLLNTLRLGRDGLDSIEDRLRTMGLALTRVDAAMVEQMNDAFTLLRATITGVIQRIAIELAPVLVTVLNRMNEVGAGGFNAGELIREGIDRAIASAGVFADILQGIRAAWIGVKAEALTTLNVVIEKTALVAFELGSLLAKLPGYKAQGTALAQTANAIALRFSFAAKTAREEWSTAFDELASDPWSERMKSAIDEVREAMRKTAAEIAAATENTGALADAAEKVQRLKLARPGALEVESAASAPTKANAVAQKRIDEDRRNRLANERAANVLENIDRTIADTFFQNDPVFRIA